MTHPITKEIISQKTCLGLLHRGPYNEIGSKFWELFDLLNEKESLEAGDDGGCKANTRGGKVLGLYLDNPEKTKPADLRSYAAFEITPEEDDDKKYPTKLEKIQVVGGPAAVLTVNGSYSQLGGAWQSFGGRIIEQGWKLSSNPEHISQEMYITMDKSDERQLSEMAVGGSLGGSDSRERNSCCVMV